MGLGFINYLGRNRELAVGLALLIGLVAFAVIGGLLVDPQNARPLSARVLQAPSWALPFGSDRQGRNLFAVITTGTLLTLRIGLIAGILGVGVGATIAFVAAYYGGWVDSVLRSIVDVGLTVPNLMILIVVSLTLREGMTVNFMALVIASLAWLYPARTIRSQVLTLRERAYVQIARLSGTSGPGIIIKELMPNLLPYLMASTFWVSAFSRPRRSA
jgi:peptide/nickel transport system permease protein